MIMCVGTRRICMRSKSNKKKKRNPINVILSVIGILLLLVIIAIGAYMIWEKPPEVEPEAPQIINPKQDKPTITIRPAENSEQTEDIDDTSIEPTSERDDGIYTILFVGSDAGKANTDTMVVGKFDTVNHKLDLVSIPRDTCINMAWDIRKVNAVYGGDIYYGGNGVDALKAQLKRLMGFEVDCYAIIDLDVFIDTIDIMGGVYFDVPQDMDYEDPTQNLYIHLNAGYQLLDGYNAMCCCRYRSGYVDGDRGRIVTQQKFLRAVADQFLTAGNIPNINKVIDRLSEGLTTDLSAANIAFFLRQTLLCKKEDINFYTVPTTGHTIYKYSYAVINLDDWVQMINEHLNPYNTPVTADNLDVVYNTPYGYGCTGVMYDPGYYSRVPEPEVVEQPTDTGGGDEPVGDLPDPEGPAPETVTEG